MRVLVCGSRNWEKKGIIKRALYEVGKIDIIIEGECRGADLMARQVAESFDIPVLKFPADWDKYGKSAGMIRNKQMLDEGKPDIVLAFTDDLDSSKGTKGMVNLARKSGIPVKVISSYGI